jgi:hypothetical protein
MQEESAAEGEQERDQDSTDQNPSTIEGDLAHVANSDNNPVTSRSRLRAD